MKPTDLIPFVRVVGIGLYFFIAAQGAFYHFGFAKALYNIPAEHFIELRKAVDPVVRSKFKFLYFSTLGVLLIWVLLTDKSLGFWSIAPVIFALILLVADMVLVVRFSEPLNTLINNDLLQTPKGFAAARAEWLKFILIRGYLSLAGLALLVLQLAFGSR